MEALCSSSLICLTRSSISLPGLKVTTYFSATSTRSPVRGLRALRAARFFTSNTPKFLNSMRLSVTRVSTIASNVFCTISLVLSCVSPMSSAMAFTISFFVTTHCLLSGRCERLICSFGSRAEYDSTLCLMRTYCQDGSCQTVLSRSLKELFLVRPTRSHHLQRICDLSAIQLSKI